MPAIALPRTRVATPQASDPFAGRSWAVLSFVTDLAMMWLAIALAFALEPRGTLPGQAWLFAAGLAAGTLGHLAARGAYGARSDRRSALDTGRDVLSAHAAGAALALAAAALLSPGTAVTTALVLAAGLSTLCVGVGRGLLHGARLRARRLGRSGEPTLIVGAGWVGAELERRLLTSPGLGLRPVGFLDDDPAPAFRDAAPSGRVLGSSRDLANVARRTGARHVIVAFSAERDQEVLSLVRAAQALGLEVSIVPRMFEDVSVRQHIEHVGGMALCRLRTPHPRGWLFAVKHTGGRAIALGLLTLAAPLMLALAAAVRLSSPGPVLFRQRRVGRDGQIFEILKLRTMRSAAAPASSSARHLAALGSAPGGVEDGDDRRTRVGTLMRRTSLDELPQLLNVVCGHMSLVGPRPERPEFVALFGQEIRGYGDRHRVKSGITGWAQVHGLRGQTSIAERIELDNWYVANWSLWLDVKILLLTPLEVLRSRAEAVTGRSADSSHAATADRVVAADDARTLHSVAPRS